MATPTPKPTTAPTAVPTTGTTLPASAPVAAAPPMAPPPGRDHRADNRGVRHARRERRAERCPCAGACGARGHGARDRGCHELLRLGASSAQGTAECRGGENALGFVRGEVAVRERGHGADSQCPYRSNCSALPGTGQFRRLTR